MTARGITRRSLLAAGAGSLAGGSDASHRRAGRARAVRRRRCSQQRGVGALAAHGLTIDLARNADMVGVQWRAPAGAHVELRFQLPSGAWSAWVDAGPHGHGPDDPAPSGGLVVGDPVWTGGTRAVQLRATRALSGVRLHLVDVSAGAGARAQATVAGALGFSAALALATPVLQAGPGQPPIIARSAWAQGVSHPRVAPQYGTVRMAFVHHTDNPNGYSAGEVPAMLRAIYVFHRYVNGWNDIGYNFAIDAYGRIFEARAGGVDEPVIGAHAGGYNYASSGIAVLGTYSSQPISAAAHAALERLLAWKLALHGVPAQGRVTVRVDPAGAIYSRFPANAPVSLPRIAGHRDADTTDCPGDALYAQLPSSRARVQRLAPSPLRLTLALASAPAPATTPAPGEPGSTAPSTPPPAPAPSETAAPPTPAGPPPAPAATEALEGVLELLDGTPIAGAAITVQARSVTRRGELVRERTIAQAVTDAQGRWSAPVSSSASSAGGMALRALYAGTNQPGAAPGAAVSDPLHVAGTLISPAGSPAAPGAPPTEQAA